MPMVSDGVVDPNGAATRHPTAAIPEEMDRMRGRTLALIEPLREEALRRQVCDFMSPLLWDLGHIADFERLWLVDALQGRDGEGLQEVFDAQATPRSARNGDDLPGKQAALAVLDRVRTEVLRRLESIEFDDGDALLDDGFVYRMVLQHEAQHQETMLQALDLPAARWGYSAATLEPTELTDHRVAATAAPTERAKEGAAATPPSAERAGDDDTVDDEERLHVPAGAFVMGTDDRSCTYDNERGSHQVTVDAFDIERYPVTNRRWQQFVRDDGYRRDELWSAEGAAWRRDNAITCPQGWVENGEGWRVRRLGRELALDPLEPVQHVSFWEAEAFAAWAGGRLPREAEWEKAVAWGPGYTAATVYPWGNRLDRRAVAPGVLDGGAEIAGGGPPRIGARPRFASAYGVEDAFGTVYQWTSSRFRPYPGFEAFPYAGYSEVFFGDVYRVLRGASWAADAVLWRNTYRNWDFPRRRQIFAGLRLVYNV